MPDDNGNDKAPAKVKRFFKWLTDDGAKAALSELKEAVQMNPLEYAVDTAVEMLKGEGNHSKIIEGIVDVDTDQLSKDLAHKIRSIMNNRGAIEFSETIGAIITEPILSVLESYAAKDDFDPTEFARAFHGQMIILGMPKTIGTLLDIEVAGTKLGDIGKALDSVYWSLGLGFLGWQTLAPLLSAGLQPRLERHYNKMYHPKRLNLSDMIYLYMVGNIRKETLTNFIEEEGYNPYYVPHLIENSFRTLNRGELEELYQLGKVSRSDIYNQFIRQGYRPEHAEHFTSIVITNSVTQGKEASLGNLRQAYKKGLRSGTEFRDALEILGFSKEAINLELELLNYDKVHERRELSVAQIKQAYILGKLSKTDVISALRDLTYNAEDTNTLLQTWDAEKAPKILKLNQSTILAAYNAGVINQSQALARLLELGYLNDSATLLIKTAIANQNRTGYKIALPMLMEARKINAISDSEFNTRLAVEGLDQTDIKIINALVKYEPTPSMTALDIERAYKANVIPIQTARSYLQQLGYKGGSLELKLNTFEQEKLADAPKLSIGTLLLYYRQGIVDSVQLRSKLRSYDYTDSDIDLFMKSANLAIPDDLTRQEIEDLYMSGVIDRSRALVLLKKTGLDDTESGLLVKGYDVTLDNLQPEPSISDYITAYRNGIINQSEFTIKLRELNYDTNAIQFYLRYAETEEKEATASLSKSDILNAYVKGLFDRYNTLQRLIDKGYSRADAEVLIDLKAPKEKPEKKV